MTQQQKSCSKSYAVIGMGFGDEGKGMVTHALSKYLSNPLVVRYSGGQQAGHTVMPNPEVSHVFSNFGSGTFSGAPTYWSKHCTVDPVGIVGELGVLEELPATKETKAFFPPKLYLDRKAPITTPFEKYINRNSDKDKEHGTCGLGVGATYEREENFFSLLAEDLLHPFVFRQKMELIQFQYYNNPTIPYKAMKEFEDCCCWVSENVFIGDLDEVYDGHLKLDTILPPSEETNVIFEGSQGLLLDQHIGFFPHVTRSNVGTKNILDMGFEPHVLMVTRAFHTRHGNGPLEYFDNSIKENQWETNKVNKYQGEFRQSLLNLNWLRYGMIKDDYLRKSSNKTLIITCMDLMDKFEYTINNQRIAHPNRGSFINGIKNYMEVDSVYFTSSPWDTSWVEDFIDANES